MVDETILNILRQRMVECVMYYSEDRHFKCKKETDDFTTSETNYFAKCKYSDHYVNLLKLIFSVKLGCMCNKCSF